MYSNQGAWLLKRTPPNYPLVNTRFLDGLRGLAAIHVMIGHARVYLHEGYRRGFLLHPDAYSVLEKLLFYVISAFRYGHAAVIFFFVLSGFVIHPRYAKAAVQEPFVSRRTSV